MFADEYLTRAVQESAWSSRSTLQANTSKYNLGQNQSDNEPDSLHINPN